MYTDNSLLYTEFRQSLPVDWFDDQFLQSLKLLESVISSDSTANIESLLMRQTFVHQKVINLLARASLVLKTKSRDLELDYASYELAVRESSSSRLTKDEVRALVYEQYPEFVSRTRALDGTSVLVDHIKQLKYLLDHRKDLIIERSINERAAWKDSQQST